MDSGLFTCLVDYEKCIYKYTEPFIAFKIMQRLYSEPEFDEEKYPVIAVKSRLLMRYILKGDLKDSHTIIKLKKLENSLMYAFVRANIVRYVRGSKCKFVYVFGSSDATYNNYCKIRDNNDNKKC